MAGAAIDKPCPHCGRPVGEHTINGWTECLQAAGMDYTIPYAEVPDGPIHTPDGSHIMVGEVTIKAATMDTAIGRLPALMITFYSPGADPMSHVPSPEYALIGDIAFLRQVERLVHDSVRGAIKAASA